MRLSINTISQFLNHLKEFKVGKSDLELEEEQAGYDEAWENELQSILNPILRVKRLTPAARIPTYAHPGDAGLDLVATEVYPGAVTMEYRTGLAIEIPPGYVGLIFPRSSIHKEDLLLSNSVGVIDSGYRGELKVVFKKTGNLCHYSAGDKIAQLVLLKCPMLIVEEVDELEESERGEGGFGSSGR